MLKKIIDISEHNGYIDFNLLKNSGISGVIIRVGWLGNKHNHTIDSYFEDYYKKAKENGLDIGFYVFSYCQSLEAIEDGIMWTYEQLKNKNFNLPVFLDLEDDEHSSTKISICGKNLLTSQALKFCNYFENLGIKSGVYASKDWFNRLVDPYKLENYKIWLAEWYVDSPTVSYKVDLWQYTNKEKVMGIYQPSYGCDCNICYCENSNNENINNGDDEEVKKYKNGSTPEEVFADTNLSVKVGTLFPYGECDCLGIFNNKAMIRYPIYQGNTIVNYKIGFVGYLGGIE